MTEESEFSDAAFYHNNDNNRNNRIWLEAGGKLFPHSGKYVAPALSLLNGIIADLAG